MQLMFKCPVDAVAIFKKLNRNGWEKLVDGASSKSQYFWKSRIIDETSTRGQGFQLPVNAI